MIVAFDLNPNPKIYCSFFMKLVYFLVVHIQLVIRALAIFSHVCVPCLLGNEIGKRWLFYAFRWSFCIKIISLVRDWTHEFCVEIHVLNHCATAAYEGGLSSNCSYYINLTKRIFHALSKTLDKKANDKFSNISTWIFMMHRIRTVHCSYLTSLITLTLFGSVT